MMGTFFALFFLGILLLGLFRFGFLQTEESSNYDEVPNTNKVDIDRLCKGPHKWLSIEVVNPEKKVENSLVCTDCGYLGQWNQMISMELVNNAIARKAALKRKEEWKQEFISQEESKLTEILSEKELTMDKIWSIYYLGQTAGERFVFFQFKKLEEDNNKDLL